MEEIIKFIKEYWVQIMFIVGLIGAFIKFSKAMMESIKCSLRNDILEIYDRCKKDKKITHYQLQSIEYSSELYFKLKGNSFVKDVIDKVKQFELVD